jgi:iron-sulfur cluster repair protein YtfE (RIC family)
MEGPPALPPIQRGAGDKTTIVRQVLTELEVHSKLEEEVFYPAIQGQGQNLQQEVAEAYCEHRAVDGLIEELKATDPADPGFHVKVRTLMADEEHHVQEEESQMLPDAEQKLGGQAEQIAHQMTRCKQELLQQLTGARR